MNQFFLAKVGEKYSIAMDLFSNISVESKK